MGEEPIKPIKPKNKGGRPQKSHKGLSLDKRLSILKKIALDENNKASERISAVDLITKLLNDKIKDAADGTVETIISFKKDEKDEKDEKEPTKLIPEPIEVNKKTILERLPIITAIPENISENASNTVSETTNRSILLLEQKNNASSISCSFVIDQNDNSDKLDE